MEQILDFVEPNWTRARRWLRIRLKETFDVNVFSEFSDSVPNPTHDRCERSVQMRIYTLNKSQFGILYAVSLLAYVLCIFIGLAGPPITTTIRKPLSEIYNLSTINPSTGPIELRSPLVSAYCQQLWLFVEFSTSSATKNSIYKQSFSINSEATGLSDENGPETFLFTSSVDPDLVCRGNDCESVIVNHIWFLSFPQYKFTITFDRLQEFHRQFKIKDMNFYWKSYNPAFTQMEIWFRFLFVFFTFLIICWFFNSLKQYSIYHWSLEQQWVALLLPLVLLYDNPMFPLVFLVNNWLPGVLDAIFQVFFLCALLLFWLCVYHGIRQNSRSFQTFYLPKLILVGGLAAAALALSVWDRYDEAKDPSYQFQAPDGSYFQALKMFFYVAGGIYVLCLIFLIVRAYGELRTLPYFDIRLKFFTILTLLVVFATILITVFKFGIAPSLQDRFVGNLSAESNSAIQFMAFYGLLNLYIYIMAYVYSPNPELIAAGLNSFEFKDVPGLPLLNEDESEEDMLYSSNVEPQSIGQSFDPDDED